jgi:hypothetical protein
MRRMTLSVLALAGPLCARGAAVPEGGAHPPRIQWFGTLEQGLAEARRTGRPILLSSATLSCQGVPGKW